MNRKEVEKVIKIILTADGGCEYCVTSLLKLFSTEFPEYKELAEAIFKEKFGFELANLSCEAKAPKDKSEYNLHGWDDEKIYFWNGKEEHCVSDDNELYQHLLEICINHFKKEKHKGSKQ